MCIRDRGDIRDDFIAQAHQPARACRSAAPVWRRWCAAACLCLVTATAVLLTARYLPLKDYKDGDTNYSPSQPITNYQIGVEACYTAPDPGEYFCFLEVMSLIHIYMCLRDSRSTIPCCWRPSP